MSRLPQSSYTIISAWLNYYAFSKILYVLYILRYKKSQKLSPQFVFLQKALIVSIVKVNSCRSNTKAEVTLCPCIPLPFQTEKDGSHISMTHAFSSTFSVFLSSFRRILDFFLLFLCFMSIPNCSAPYFLWLPENFGLFYAFSVLYVHFLLLSSVFPSGFRMILSQVQICV